MRPDAIGPYENALRAGSTLSMVDGGGRAIHLDVRRFAGPADDADSSVLDRARPAVLDLGCGPGRLVAELIARGVPALGVDVSAEAVRMTVRRGGRAVQAGMFDPLPDVGGWGTVLLIDGNIGIDGDPVKVLRRATELVAADGEILVETVSRRGPTGPFRFADGAGLHEPTFGWSVVTDAALADLAALAGLVVATRWRHGGRSFSALQPR